ncbi:MAG TPA: tyrosine-protein phosphatase [Actinomycetes bacterium]|nr:tyrosine-protein phosphatase [Actinomycetes bacterium]
MSGDREVAWEGFFNARDLGGLPTRDRRVTRHGRLIRSADLRLVTKAGWRAAYDAGVRTVIDLRNDDEVRPHAGPSLTALGGSAHLSPRKPIALPPPGVTTTHVPLDDVEDIAFWRYLNSERLNGTPLYFRPFLERKPQRCATAVAAIAHAQPGGVIFHCGGGRDRTGLVALLLLALVDVEPDSIAADYELSTEPRRALLAAMGMKDDLALHEQALADRGTTARAAVLATLQGFDAETCLRSAGLTADDLARIRSRLLV